MTPRRPGDQSQLGRWRSRGRLTLSGALTLLAAVRAEATPRMISYGYPSCLSCHVSVQGRGLLNSYGRGIDIAQSYSKKDFTALLLGRGAAADVPSDNWDGRFGAVLADFLVTLRFTQVIDRDKSDRALVALYRQAIFLDQQNLFRINTEIGLLDGGLNETRLGPALTATGGDNTFLKKLLLEWRFDANESTSGKELAFGRDYLPLGLQIDDYASYILFLNRAGVYDFPLQLKYFVWDEKSLASAFIHAPSFEEQSDRREYGGGFLYERYLGNNLVLGVQGLAGFSEEADRLRIGPYLRWGISPKWALLAQADYGGFWGAGVSGGAGSQVTTYLQLFYHHYEWLISGGTINYAHSDVLMAKNHLASFRYTAAARFNRNFTLGLSYLVGDSRRDLSYAQELTVFATIKF